VASFAFVLSPARLKRREVSDVFLLETVLRFNPSGLLLFAFQVQCWLKRRSTTVIEEGKSSRAIALSLSESDDRVLVR